jgi:hypothetical protein
MRFAWKSELPFHMTVAFFVILVCGVVSAGFKLWHIATFFPVFN